MAARVLDELRRGVETHRLAVEQRRAERRRMVALEPRRDVDQQREARGMRFREAVFAEAEDLPVKPIGELRAIAMAHHSFFQLALEVLQSAALLPCRHRA